MRTYRESVLAVILIIAIIGGAVAVAVAVASAQAPKPQKPQPAPAGPVGPSTTPSSQKEEEARRKATEAQRPSKPVTIEQRPVRPDALPQQFIPHKASELPRFRTPSTTPPRVTPPIPTNKVDHTWRWHRHHGWVLLPIRVAPVELVLPVTYTLPQEVITYQAIVQPAAKYQVVCPHCGRTILVEIK